MSRRKEYNIITPIDLRPKPDEYEYKVAMLVAHHFKSDVKFVKREITTTPDVLVLRYSQQWEIKNIKGNSKHTIRNNLRNADGQSEYVIISLLRTKMTQQQAVGRIKQFFEDGPVKIKKLLLITRMQKVLVIKNK